METTQPKQQQNHHKTKKWEKRRKWTKEMKRYRQYRLAKSLFSTFCCFSAASFDIHCYCFPFSPSIDDCRYSTMKKKMQTYTQTMMALFKNSVAIYGFVMHSSVCTLVVCWWHECETRDLQSTSTFAPLLLPSQCQYGVYVILKLWQCFSGII